MNFDVNQENLYQHILDSVKHDHPFTISEESIGDDFKLNSDYLIDAVLAKLEGEHDIFNSFNFERDVYTFKIKKPFSLKVDH